MIATIRTYFDARVKAVDPELSFYEDDVFGDNDVNAVEAQNNYNLIIGTTNTTRQDNGFLDEVEVELDVWSSKGVNIYDDYETLYCLAYKIKNECIKLENVAAEDCLSEVEAISITPLEEPTNDNVFKMRLNFIVRLYYRP